MSKDLLQIAINAAKAAGDFLKKRESIVVDDSLRRDIKLSSDKLSEKIILDELFITRIPILSEEKGFVGKDSNLCWIVDPLDGTVNYYRGIDDLACVSIALWENGTPILGVVNRFMTGEIFSGTVGQGAWLNGQRIKSSEIKEMRKAVVATGLPTNRDFSDEALASFISQLQRAKKIRMLGAAALMASFVSCGRVDAYMEDNIMIWDVAGAVAIILAAGGIADLAPQGENKYICRCFATKELKEDFLKNAQ